MNNLEKFCSIVKKRSEENAQSIKLLYENKLYGNCVAILRQELDSMVRVLFLLSQPPNIREQLINQTLNNEKWKIGNKQIKDFMLVDSVINFHGWARNVYYFECAFIHLSSYSNYFDEDIFNTISKPEKEVIKNFMVQYQEFPQNLELNFETIKPYILKIFDKINGNLACHLEDLCKNPIETQVM